MLFKNKAEYLDLRNKMLNDANILMQAGKKEEFDSKAAEIERLDNDWDNFKLEAANRRSLEDKFVSLDLENAGKALEGKVIEDMGEIGKNTLKNQLTMNNSAVLAVGNLIPKQYGTEIITKFNEVSGILDMVRFMELKGGSELNVPYSDETKIGSITEEGGAYADTGGTFAAATLKQVKITGLAEYSEEMERLASADFENFIITEIDNSVKKKIVQQLISGTGDGQFSGLYSSIVVPVSQDIELTTIDAETLNKIVFGHNPADESMGMNVLVLNKKDLGEFANVRTTDGSQVYKITFNPTGTSGFINDTVPFVICNQCKDIKNALVGDYTMIYGDLKKVMIAFFSDIEIKKDYSTGFKTGMIAIKGSVMAGGGAVSPTAISRIKKKA